MKQEELKRLASELVKDVKTEKDLSALTSELVKLTVEAALSAEMDNHLGYAKHDSAGTRSGNSRNGYSSKTL
jgi:transposase-like protein